MKKLLFVDDEQPVLHFLRHSLRTLARDWQMEFVLSAETALKVLAKTAFDVVLAKAVRPEQVGSGLPG